MLGKFKKNNWKFYKEYKSTRRDNKDGIVLEFHKDNYIAEVELFSSVIVIRFWYKGYYE